MSDQEKIKIGKVNLDLSTALNKTIDDVVEANNDIRSATASIIEKRGFVYNGDTHNHWGLSGTGMGAHGTTGFLGGAPFYGRGLEMQLKGFSLQPFGIGAHGILSGGSSFSSSVFAGSGSNVRLKKTTQIARLKMAMCVEAYKGFGIVKNVIDLMCNFASEGITVIHPSPAVQRFYRRWFEAVDMEGVVKKILRYYYKYGNVFIYTIMGLINKISYDKMRSARGEAEINDSDIVDTNDPNSDKRRELIEREKRKDIENRQIPWRYTLLNPFQMDIRGGKYFGQTEWVFLLDEDAINDIKNNKSRPKDTDVLDESDVGLPPEFRNLAEKDKNLVVPDSSKLWTIHYMKDDHEDWADPMVWPVMNDIVYKNSLRAMDISVVNSTINAITIFKLGDIKSGYVAGKEHYRKLSQMLRTPSYSHNIVWNDAISMESNYPPIEKILSIDKYRSVDRDILAGLGVPGILVSGGEGGSFANAFLQVRTLLERLEDGRTEVMKWLNKQLRMVAEIMGHRQIPTVKFGQMSLRDEQAEKKLVIQLLDRNIISAERVHEVFGIETQVEIERMKREMKLAEDNELMIKFGPFKDPMNMMMYEDQMELEGNMEMKRLRMQQRMRQTQMRSQRTSKTGPAGRPGGINTPHEEKRDTKPSGMGLGYIYWERIKQQAEATYASVESRITDMYLSASGADYKKSLAKDQRDELDELINIVYSQVDIYDYDDNTVAEILENLKPNADYLAIYARVSDQLGVNSIQDRRLARAIAMTYKVMGDSNAL